jgi:hypothetical protein
MQLKRVSCASAGRLDWTNILSCAQLGGAVKVCGMNGLVSAQSHYSANAAIHGSINHVFTSNDVRLNRLKWVMFACRNLLERAACPTSVNSRKGAFQALRIAHISEEIPQRRVIQTASSHFVLFQFVTTEDDQLLTAIFVKHDFDKPSAERTSAAG